MPGTDGFDVLRWLRKQPEFASIRVVVMTSSETMRDVNLAYQLGANSFIVKDIDLYNSMEMARIVTRYWLHSSLAPEASRNSPKPNQATSE